MAKIYLSSTFSDLKEYRQAAYEALERMDHLVKKMESYVSGDERPLAKCLKDVEQQDLYIGLFAWRNGFVPPDPENAKKLSITELEYCHAKAHGKPCLIFIVSDDLDWKPAHIEKGPGAERLEALKKEFRDARIVSEFDSPDDLAAKLTAAVRNWEQSEEKRKGQPKTPASSPAGDAAGAAAGRVAPQFREVTRHALVLFDAAADTAFASALAKEMELFGRTSLLSPRALFPDTRSDYLELERMARQCHAALLVLSDASADRLKARPEHAGRVIELLHARTGCVACVGRTAGGLAAPAALGLSAAVDATAWTASVGVPTDLVTRVLDAIKPACPPVTDSTPTVGLPFLVVAMTDAEAAVLESNPEVVEDELGSKVFEQFQKLVAGLTALNVAPFGGRYRPARQAWTPFRQGAQPVGGLVEKAVLALNDASPTAFRDRRVKVQYYPFDALVREDDLLLGIYDELAQTGCVIVADELSLFHPRVAHALTGSPLFGSAKVAMMTVSPFDPGGLEVEQVLELALRRRMNPPYRRFHSDYDPHCEFGVGDTRRLLRWLHSTLPQTLSRLREVQPDARSIQAYFAQKLGREPSGPGFASQLFRPEDAL